MPQTIFDSRNADVILKREINTASDYLFFDIQSPARVVSHLVAHNPAPVFLTEIVTLGNMFYGIVRMLEEGWSIIHLDKRFKRYHEKYGKNFKIELEQTDEPDEASN